MFSLSATKVGAAAIPGALGRAGLNPADVADVFRGNALSAGLGQAPVRRASLGAKIPVSVSCMIINKTCGSETRAAGLAYEALAASAGGIFLGSGMKSMSNARFPLPRVCAGVTFGHEPLVNHIALDRLEDAWEPGGLMGTYAEETGEKPRISRVAQDEFAAHSLLFAQRSASNGALADEIVEGAMRSGNGTLSIRADEQPAHADAEKIGKLEPAFRQIGTATAANCSSISDAAATVLLASESEAEACSVAPLACIVAHATYAEDLAWVATAPIGRGEALALAIERT